MLANTMLLTVESPHALERCRDDGLKTLRRIGRTFSKGYAPFFGSPTSARWTVQEREERPFDAVNDQLPLATDDSHSTGVTQVQPVGAKLHANDPWRSIKLANHREVARIPDG